MSDSLQLDSDHHHIIDLLECTFPVFEGFIQNLFLLGHWLIMNGLEQPSESFGGEFLALLSSKLISIAIGEQIHSIA